MNRLIASPLAIAAGPVIAAATNTMAYEPPTAPAGPTGGFLLWRLATLTLVSLGLCIVVIWAARSGRWRARPPAHGPSRLVRVCDLALDRRSSIHLLNVAGRRVVLGLDSGGLKSMVLLPESFDGVLDGAVLTE